MMENILGGAIVALITGAFAWLAARTSARGQLQAEEAKATAPNWIAFTEKLELRIDALEEDVRELRAEVDKWRSGFYAAIDHIREWRRKYPIDSLSANPPESIRSEL